jgi:hypothetical protein
MADLNSLKDAHAKLDLVCTSLERLFQLSLHDHADLVEAAQPALLMFRQALDDTAKQGWSH